MEVQGYSHELEKLLYQLYNSNALRWGVLIAKTTSTILPDDELQ